MLHFLWTKLQGIAYLLRTEPLDIAGPKGETTMDVGRDGPQLSKVGAHLERLLRKGLPSLLGVLGVQIHRQSGLNFRFAFRLLPVGNQDHTEVVEKLG